MTDLELPAWTGYSLIYVPRINEVKIFLSDASELTFTCLVAEVIVRLIYGNDNDANFHVQRKLNVFMKMDLTSVVREDPNSCGIVEQTPSYPPLHVPDIDSFNALLVPDFEVLERDQQVAAVIATVLHEHDEDLKKHFDDEFIEDVVRKVRYNHTSVYRLYADDNDLHMPAIGIFPTFAAFKFKNGANCDYGFDFNGNVVVRTRSLIRHGEPVEIDFQAREIADMLDRSDEEEIPL